MQLQYCFRVETDSGVKNSPRFGAEDMARLDRLFPGSSVWQGRLAGMENIRVVSGEQVRTLYDAMVQRYAFEDANDEPYLAGNAGPLPLWNNERALFESLINFFEVDLAFRATPELTKRIEERRKAAAAKKMVGLAQYRVKAERYFEELGSLSPPRNANVRRTLEVKLAEYEKRLERWRHHGPDEQWMHEGFRDTGFKILIVKKLLAAHEPVPLIEVLREEFDRHGVLLDADELARAIRTIANAYLGTTLPRSDTKKGIPPA